jgi:hypothetical protein
MAGMIGGVALRYSLNFGARRAVACIAGRGP